METLQPLRIIDPNENIDFSTFRMAKSAVY